MGGRGKHTLLEQQGQNNRPERALLPCYIPHSAEGTSPITEFKPNSAMSGSRQDNKHCRCFWSSLPSSRHNVSVTDRKQTEAFLTGQTKKHQELYVFVAFFASGKHSVDF